MNRRLWNQDNVDAIRPMCANDNGLLNVRGARRTGDKKRGAWRLANFIAHELKRVFHGGHDA